MEERKNLIDTMKGVSFMTIITNEETSLKIDSYCKALQNEMIKLGAEEKDFDLIKDATIRNALRRNRKPKDVAWALLQ